MTTPNELAGLIERLRNDKGTTPYYTRRQLMLEAADMLEQLSPTKAPEPLVERYSYQQLFDAIAAATRIEMGGTAIGVSVKDFHAALSSSISNAEAVDFQGRPLTPISEDGFFPTTATEDSGEVVQADVHEVVCIALQRLGYWQFEMVLGGDGGFEADWRTKEGVVHRLAARQSPDSLVDGQITCPQIAMGHGLVDVGQIHFDGRKGIILHPRAKHIPVGELGDLAGDYWPTAGDVVIWIDKPEGADVILKELAPLASLSKSPSDGEG